MIWQKAKGKDRETDVTGEKERLTERFHNRWIALFIADYKDYIETKLRISNDMK